METTDPFMGTNGMPLTPAERAMLWEANHAKRIPVAMARLDSVAAERAAISTLATPTLKEAQERAMRLFELLNSFYRDSLLPVCDFVLMFDPCLARRITFVSPSFLAAHEAITTDLQETLDSLKTAMDEFEKKIITAEQGVKSQLLCIHTHTLAATMRNWELKLRQTVRIRLPQAKTHYVG